MRKYLSFMCDQGDEGHDLCNDRDCECPQPHVIHWRAPGAEPEPPPFDETGWHNHDLKELVRHADDDDTWPPVRWNTNG